MSFKKVVKTAFSVFLSLLLVLLAGLTFLPFWGEVWRSAEISCHFVPLYAAFCLIYILIVSLMRRWPSALIALVLLAINTYRLLPLYEARDEGGRSDLKVMHLNLWGPKNRSPRSVFAAVRRQAPQVVAFSEIDGRWLKRLDQLNADYPYHLATSHCGGIGVWSKLPLGEGEIEYFAAEDKECGLRPRLRSSVILPSGKRVGILVVHPLVPVGKYANFRGRNREFQVIADEARSLPRPCFVVGDLNCSPWSPYFAKLASSAGLKDSARGYGLAPTWPEFWMFKPMIPIDHCLVSCDIAVTNRSVLDWAGSDHRPLLIDLALE